MSDDIDASPPVPAMMPDALRRSRFGVVVLPHLDDGYDLARWLTGNAADADDVVQDAALRAFQHVEQYRGGDARAWFLTIVRRTAYTSLSRRRSESPAPATDATALERAMNDAARDGPDPPAETPETSLLRQEEGARLHAAVARLAPEFREAIVLRELHDLSYKQIAHIAGVPIGTVMSRLSRAREMLLRLYGEDER